MYDATLVFKDGVSLHFTDDKLLVFCNAPGGAFERNKDGWEFRCNEKKTLLFVVQGIMGCSFLLQTPW